MYSALEPEDEEGDEPAASDGSLSSSSEREGTTWGSEAGGVAISATGGRQGVLHVEQ